ncbi:MAG: hypothetical protein OZ921_12895 [Sorangiineae bacterium]|nr:hypothetical protein [Polyangiaceae bacterium]MEB2323405.1 hypothetical protein [Sorangiineae bacterium]
MYQNDIIKRAIEQTAIMLSRIAHHKREGELDEARAELDAAYAKLLRIDRASFESVDSRTAAGLVGPAPAVRNVARLCRLEAELLDDAGEPVRASLKRRRALELLLEAERLEPSTADRAELDELRAVVPAERLAARYR